MGRMSRRRFLKMVGLMGMYAAALRVRQPVWSQNRSHDVVIIGAGMAGLSAARILKTHGANVVVLEGRQRVGGRIWTDRSLGTPIDLGASWIHGVNGNPITEMAAEMGVKTTATDYDNIHVYDRDGRYLNDAQLEAAFEPFDDLEELIEAHAESLSRDVSMGSVIRQILREDPLDVQSRRFLNWQVASMEVESAVNLDRLSLMYAEADDGFDGEDRLFPGGYDQLVRGMAKGMNIKLGHVVKGVEYSREGVRVYTNHGHFDAEAAIVTLPLGILKSGKVKFSPALPIRKQHAIRRLDMGVLNKVALTFPKIFWPTDRHFLGYVSDEKGEFPSFLNWAKYTGKPALMAFTGGRFAREMEAYSNEEIGEAVMEVLHTLYGNKVVEPSGIKIARWASDPFAHGSYSHIPVGATPADYDSMAAPVGDRLYFAGEATTREYPGTVHGAFLSGLWQGVKVAEAFA